MRWKALILAALLFSVAAFVSTLNGSNALDRITGALSVLPIVLLLCTASLVRALYEKENR